MPLLSHILDVVFLGVVFVGPVPLSLGAAARGGNTDSLSHRLLVASLWWCAAQCSLGIALGLVGQLRSLPLLICEIAVAFLGASAWRHSRFVSLARRWLTPSRPLDWRLALIGAVLASATATLLVRALTQPITEFDSLAYHLPQIAYWFQNGSLDPLPNLRQIARYPFSWEVLQLMFVLPFHEDFAIGLPNLFAWTLLALATYRLACCLGATRLAAAACAVLCVSVPDAAFQVRTSFVDVALAAFFASALYLVCEQRRAGTNAPVPTILVAAGVMLGIKASAVVLFCLLIAVGGVLRLARFPAAAREQEPRSPRESAPRPLLLVALAAFVWLGGFWYVRNWIQVGNPLGFVPVRIAGVELFAGDEFYADLGRTSIARIFDLRSTSDWGFLWRAVRARWDFPFLVLSALLPFVPWVLLRATHATRRAILLMVALAGVHALLYWYSPYTGAGNNGSQGLKVTAWIANGLRYAMPLVASIAVLGSLVVTRLGWLSPLAWSAAMAGCVFMMIRHGSTSALAWGIPLGVVAWTRWTLGPRVSTLKHGALASRLLASLAVVVMVAASLVARDQRDQRRDIAYGRVQTAIESVVPRGATVGYVMSVRSYPFYGRYLDRRVDFVPAGDRDQLEWIRYMRSRGIRVVAVGPMRKEFADRKELAWLRAQEGPFQRIFGVDPNRDSILFLLPE